MKLLEYMKKNKTTAWITGSVAVAALAITAVTLSVTGQTSDPASSIGGSSNTAQTTVNVSADPSSDQSSAPTGQDHSSSSQSSNMSSSASSTSSEVSQSTVSSKPATPPVSNKPAVSSKTQSSSKTAKPPVSKPAASSKPTPPKSAFAKPFNIAAMKAELIAYGKSLGMTHITHQIPEFGGWEITPEGTTWRPPVQTRLYSSAAVEKMKADLQYKIKYWGDQGIPTFTLWFEPDSNYPGDYIIYVIIA